MLNHSTSVVFLLCQIATTASWGQSRCMRLARARGCSMLSAHRPLVFYTAGKRVVAWTKLPNGVPQQVPANQVTAAERGRAHRLSE